MEKKGTKWGWIIFWLIFFWPVGLFLMIRKFATDKSALMSGKTGTILVVGWILVVFGILCLCTEIEAPDTFGIVFSLLILLGGVLLLRKERETKKTAAKYKKYINIVVNQDVRNMDDIVSAVGLSYDEVAKDLQSMIDIGYLKDAYIHHSNRQIILKQPEMANHIPYAAMNQVSAVPKSVRCPGCGANNVVVVGRVSECEYCGTPINA